MVQESGHISAPHPTFSQLSPTLIPSHLSDPVPQSPPRGQSSFANRPIPHPNPRHRLQSDAKPAREARNPRVAPKRAHSHDGDGASPDVEPAGLDTVAVRDVDTEPDAVAAAPARCGMYVRDINRASG